MKKQHLALSGLFVLMLTIIFSASLLIGGSTRIVEASVETGLDSYCTIPASGPWPPCATGGGNDSGGSNECVIPASGPWPACATNGSGGGSGGSSSGECVIPASGPWPACATGGGSGSASGGGAPTPAPASPPPAPAAEPQPLPIRTGNLSYFAFDETGSSILDSNTGATGSINGNVNRIAGPRNTALNISSGGSVFIPDGNNITVGTGNFTIAMWVRVSQQSGVQSILDRRTTEGALVGYHVFTSDGKLGMQLADGNGNVNKCKQDNATPRCTNYITNKFIADGQWHFIVITVDRDGSRGMRFWVDNVVIDQMNPRGRQGSLDSNQDVPLVMVSSGSTLDVDEFYLYGKVLSDDQIAFIYRNRQ